MASITANVSSDLNVINISYSLHSEDFVHITARPFSATYGDVGNSFVILSPEATIHSGISTGTYGTNVVSQSFINSGNTFEGVYVISITTTHNGGAVEVVSSANILLGKTLDCCIAEKMITAVDCNCDDDKCNESLLDAQKMFLFKQSAEYVLNSIGQGEALTSINRLAALNDAKNKYKKAIELCTSGCGCNNSPS